MIRMRRLPFRPFLGKDQPSFDGFSKANLVGENRSLRQRRLEGKQCRFDLVRIEIHLRVQKRASELLGIGNGMPLAQLVSK